MMVKDLSETKIKEILKDIFKNIAPEVEFDKINLQQALRDQIDIDSYDFYRMLIKINEETGVDIPDAAVRDLRNLNDLIKYILNSKKI